MKKILLKYKFTILDTALVVFIAALFIGWGLRITADMTNILAGPDEAMRYVIPSFIFNNGYLPTGYETAIHGNWSYAFYPQLLGAIISTGFMEVASWFNVDAEGLVRAARLTSVTFGVIAAIFVRKSVRLLFEKHKHNVAIGNFAMILFALLPQVTFLSSYINNDIVALAGVSIIIYACLYVYKKELTTASAVWFAIGTVFAILGYLNSYGFVLAGFIYLFIKLIEKYKKVKDKRNLAKYLLIMAAIPALLCFPFFIRNIVLYDGDIFGVKTFHDEYVRWVEDTGIILQNPYHQGIVHLLVADRWVIETIRNFVLGYFGGWSKGVNDVHYAFYYLVGLLGAIGLVGHLKGFKWNKDKLLFAGFLFAGSLVTIVLHFYYTLNVDYQPQGRYVIYLVIPIVLGITIGLVHLIQKFIKRAYVVHTIILLSLVYALFHLVVISKTLF